MGCEKREVFVTVEIEKFKKYPDGKITRKIIHPLGCIKIDRLLELDNELGI